MFESIKKLFPSYQNKILVNAINEFNQAHSEEYQIEYWIYRSGGMASLKVVPNMYSTSTVVFFGGGPEGINSHSTDFHFFKDMLCDWSYSGGCWILKACDSLFGDFDDRKPIPLDEYLHMLHGFMKTWYELHHTVQKYNRAYIVLVDGTPEFYINYTQVSDIFRMLETSIDEDPEYREYIHKVIDLEVANKKCSSSNPETIGLTEQTPISVWTPESYHRMKTQIDSDIAQRMKRAFERLDKHRAAHQRHVEYEQRLSTFIQDANRHFRKKH